MEVFGFRRKYAALGFSVTDKVLMGDWALDGTPVYEERWDKRMKLVMEGDGNEFEIYTGHRIGFTTV